ncbi:MAG: hypothetical protein NVV66_18570 [Cellulomonas sp.]|uniref:hypothetical protein n=1 Tax=Cellulomonas sp. TaxID=40001 RepID=UPI0025909ABC|nr:hypothetical protein [Cellulomonas sp.]MCR6706600.1 hypothetical protein [Cellulomonas sp.]
MDTAVESALRLQIIAWLHERADRNGGFLHRHELLSYRTGDRDLPLIDFSAASAIPQASPRRTRNRAVSARPYDIEDPDDGLLLCVCSAPPSPGKGGVLRRGVQATAVTS